MSILGSIGKLFSTGGTILSALPGMSIGGAAASALGGLANQVDSENKQQALYQQQLVYNSPKEQMKRLQEAGLNPHLIYGSQGVTGMSASDATAPNLEQYKENPVLKLNAQQIQDMAIQRRQQLNQDKVAESQKQANEAKANEANAHAEWYNSDKQRVDNYNSIFEIVKGERQAELDLKLLQNEAQKINNSILGNKEKLSAQDLDEMLKTWPTRQKTIEQELINKVKQGKLMDANAARQYAEMSLIPLRANLLKAQEGLISRETINKAIEAGLLSDKHHINEATLSKIKAETVSVLVKSKGSIVEMYDHKGVGSWLVNPLERLIHSGDIQANLDEIDSLLFP